MNLNDIPDLAMDVISSFLTKETPYHDKVDIAIQAAILKMAGCKQLADQILYTIDAYSTDSQVFQNIQAKKRQWIDKSKAEHVWGLNNDDLSQLPNKKIRSMNKYKIMYPMHLVKRKSAIKFSDSYENLKAYTNKQQIERLNVLKTSLNKYNALLRIDSKLCDLYVKKGNGEPDKIAKHLAEMEFYHLYTNYKKYYAYFTVEHYMNIGFYDWAQITEDAKKRALTEFQNVHHDRLYIIPDFVSIY